MLKKLRTHKHDCHLELHCANDTTLNKETTHSKAVMNPHNSFCYPGGTHKHDRHLELYYANDTTLNKETTHSKAVMNL